MIPISIDTQDLSAEFSLSRGDVDEMMSFVIKELTGQFAREWGIQASRELTSARKEFMNSIVVGTEGKFRGFVMLVGSVPNMIEDGAEPFDMKLGFLASSKAKDSPKGGKYLTIPRRFGTPGALGESSLFSEVMPAEIYEIVKDKASDKSKLGGGTQRGTGLELGDIPEKYQIPKTRQRIVTKSRIYEEYQNKTSTYEGLKRSEKTYDVATQGQYVSFRRVSSQTDPNAWIHPGITARKFSDKALDALDIPAVVDKTVDQFLSKLGF